MRLLIAAAALLSVVAAARAETPEEAVAYAFMGLADGATLERGTTTMEWKETGASPARYVSQSSTGGRKYSISFTVTASDPCKYEILLEGPPTMIPTGKAVYARVDLAKVTGITVGDHAFKAAVAGDGFCETGKTNPRCMPLDTSDLFGFVDVEKHKATLAFLRDEVCPAAKQ
ncbi:MAG TPA: hypothetical protein PKA74_06650 [Bauldia sp.]|nr:hypothetical protein [Bauldia sp.]